MLGVVAAFSHAAETSCLPAQLPWFRISSPKRARSSELIQSPPPQRVPPLTDPIVFPSMSTCELLYGIHRQSADAPMGSMMLVLSTSGRLVLNSRSRESEKRLIRTSLYS